MQSRDILPLFSQPFGLEEVNCKGPESIHELTYLGYCHKSINLDDSMGVLIQDEQGQYKHKR